jgi:hypothetical protein
MREPVDILDERDPVSGPFLGSLFFHLAVVGIFVASWLWTNRTHQNLGDINPGGGPSYSVSPVHNIPIPRRDAPPNPVANDTESQVRTAPAKQDTEKKQPDKAIEIPDKQKPKRQAERPQHQQKYLEPAPQNQVYSRTRQAVSSPMYGQSGSGQVGIGPNSPLGNRLGWYAELIRERIAQNWRTNGLDVRSQSSPAIPVATPLSTTQLCGLFTSPIPCRRCRRRSPTAIYPLNSHSIYADALTYLFTHSCLQRGRPSCNAAAGHWRH